MFETYTDNFDVEWLVSDVLYVSKIDYIDIINEANMRWLTDNYTAHTLYNINPMRYKYHNYNNSFENSLYFSMPQKCSLLFVETPYSKRAYIRLTEDVYYDKELVEAVYSLSDYPCFDDDYMTALEDEMEREAWEKWLLRELMSFLPEKFCTYCTRRIPLNEEKNGVYWDAYLQATSEVDAMPMYEPSGFSIDTDVLSVPFYEALKRHIREQNMTHWKDKTWHYLPGI